MQLDTKLYNRYVDWKGRNTPVFICRWDRHVCRKNKTKLLGLRIALAVQWFGLRILTAKSLSLIPAQGMKIIPQAAALSKDKTKQNKQTKKTLLELMSDYSKIVGNKLKKSITFLCTSKE